MRTFETKKLEIKLAKIIISEINKFDSKMTEDEKEVFIENICVEAQDIINGKNYIHDLSLTEEQRKELQNMRTASTKWIDAVRHAYWSDKQ